MITSQSNKDAIYSYMDQAIINISHLSNGIDVPDGLNISKFDLGFKEWEAFRKNFNALKSRRAELIFNEWEQIKSKFDELIKNKAELDSKEWNSFKNRLYETGKARS